MVFRQLSTNARAPITNSKHCGSGWLLHNLLTSMLWTVAMVSPVLVVTSVHADAPVELLGPATIVCHDTRKAIAVGFVNVQPGFLQLLLTQSWVKCTSVDSSRCVVYSGVIFKAIQAASKN